MLLRRWVGLLSVMLVTGCSVAPVTTKIPAPEVVPAPTPVQAKTVTIAAVGDIMLGGTSRPYLEREGYDYPFKATKQLYQKADVLMGNLETPLTDRGELLVEKKYRFRNPPKKVAPALKRAGFDIVTLANNHTLDYGVQGLKDTMAALDKAGIRYHGAGLDINAARKPVIMCLKNGQKLGFLAYSNTFPKEFWAKKRRAGTAFGHEASVRADVKKLKKQVDIVVVSFHWGREGTTELRAYQPLLAHAAIDEGASLVLGHHPHILQAVEEYKKGLILYSLGNYTFGSFSNRVQTSVVANIMFKQGQFARLEMTPIAINNFKVYFQPQVLKGEQARKVFDELRQQSPTASLSFNLEAGLISLKAGEAQVAAQK